MAGESGAAPARLSIGLNSLFEDMFGLNVRGLRTVGASFIRPRLVFEAARHPHWLNRYTPSIRLAFFIMSLTAVFRFLWANEEGVLATIVDGQLAQIAEGTGQDFDRQAASQLYLGTYAAFMPFAWLAMQSLLSLVLRVWGRGTSAVLRLRLHMTAIIPSTLFGLLFLIIIPLIEDGVMFSMLWWSVASAGFAVLLDALTSFRGGVGGETPLGRITRALTFAVFVGATNVMVSLLSSLVGYIAVFIPLA
jgi:hypothetical protein